MKLVKFYEVCDHKGDALWGGTSEWEALQWFRKSFNEKIYVSVWNEDDSEEPRLVTDKIDVTKLVLTTLSEGRYPHRESV